MSSTLYLALAIVCAACASISGGCVHALSGTRLQQQRFTSHHTQYNILSYRHCLSSSTLCMSPQKGFDEEDVQIQSKKRINDVVKQYFNINTSSSVRSTSQTEAIGQKQDYIDDEEETTVPQEVLRPFSLLLLSQFILFLGVGAVIPTVPLYGQSIGLSAASNGIVISAPAVALLLISRIAGESADRGRKGAMLGGMAVIAISDVGTAFSNSLTTLVLARLGLGLGRGYAEAGERGMLTDLANKAPTLRGRALALQQACVALGIAVGAPLGGVVVQEFGARSSFLCVSAAALLSLAIYSILPETITTGGLNDVSKTTDVSKESNEADWGNLLKTSSIWRSLALAQSGSSFGFAAKIAVIPILASEYLGGATGAGLLVSAAGLAGLVGAPLGGFVTDKTGSRVTAAVSLALSGTALALVPVGLSLEAVESTTTIVDGGRSPSLVEGLSSSSSIWQSVLNHPDAASFVLLVLLWSVGASAASPALTALGQENSPQGGEATALGLPRAVGDGTYIIAPLLLGYFSDKIGDVVPGIGCAIAGGAICLGSVALLLVKSLDDSTQNLI